QTFTDICPDFQEEPSFEEDTVSRRFAQDVIFTYSKAAKTAKAGQRDTSWSIQMNVTNAKGAAVSTEVRIQTHFVREPPQFQPFVMRGCLVLSFKQASLLAVEKYCQLVPHQVKRGEIILTPLAGAVFSKDDMPKLAKAMQEPIADVMMAVISSCQTDGYYLQHSRCHIVLVALKKTVSDQKMRSSLLKKTIKMYNLQGKQFDMEMFKKWSAFVRQEDPAKPKNDIGDDEYEKMAEQVLAFQLTSKKGG
ncbi:hypothetical protein KR009_005279, partial [Drosophila setifemur]